MYMYVLIYTCIYIYRIRSYIHGIYIDLSEDARCILTSIIFLKERIETCTKQLQFVSSGHLLIHSVTPPSLIPQLSPDLNSSFFPFPPYFTMAGLQQDGCCLVPLGNALDDDDNIGEKRGVNKDRWRPTLTYSPLSIGRGG